MSNDKLKDGRKRGFYIIDNDVIDKYGEIIGVYGIAIYSLIARYADGNGENAFPSYSTICKKLGIGRGKVAENIEKLVELGLIKKEKRVDDAGDMTTNLYTIVHLGSSEWELGSSHSELPSSSTELPVVPIENYGSSQRELDQDTTNKTEFKKTSAKRQSSKTTDADAQEVKEDPTKELVKQILAAYVEVRGKNGINHGKEGAWAKRIAKEHAENTTELVKGCYLWLKKDKYLEFKVISLAKVYESLPEFIRYLEKHGTLKPSGTSESEWVIIDNKFSGRKELKNKRTGETKPYVNA